MEIRVDVSSCAEKDTLAASAYYVFVARDAKDSTKSRPVPELVFDGEKETELCMIRQQYGKKNQMDRKNVSEVKFLNFLSYRTQYSKPHLPMKKVSSFTTCSKNGTRSK
jgi:hypothetical protein